MMMSSAHANTSQLYALHLCLRPVQAGTLMPFNGELVHAAFLTWLKAAAPDISRWLHEGQKRRLFTCSSLHFNRPAHVVQKAEQGNIHLPLDPQEIYTLRLTLLLGELFPLVHEALTRAHISHPGTTASPFIQLGKQHFLLEDVLITNDDPNGWTGFTSLTTLIEQARATHFSHDTTLTLEFASLTAFNRGHRKIGYGSHTLLLPLPQFVFANLARHWQEIAPPELAGVIESERLEHYLQDDGVIIVDYNLKTHHVHFTTHQQRGFLGTCTYQLRDPRERTSDNAPLTLPQQILLLANLAFYSGVGYKTAMGLGQTRLITEAR